LRRVFNDAAEHLSVPSSLSDNPSANRP
jgi:hypothetical protein